MKNRLPIVLSLVLGTTGLLFGLTLILTTDGYPLDDAWIHLDYARSLIQSGTFGYTPGEWENGSTSPLWSILVAIPLALGSPPGDAARILGILSLALLCLAGYRAAHRVFDRFVSLLVVGILAFDPWISVLSVSGMESIAAMAATFFAIDTLLRGRIKIAGLLLVCVGLLRPELTLLHVCIALSLPLLGRGWRGGRDLRVRFRQAGWLLVPSIIVGGAWILYGRIVTGLFLPNSFWIKTTSKIDLHQQLEALAALFLGAEPTVTILIGLALLGIGRLIHLHRGLLLLFLGTPLLLTLFYVLRLPLGGPYGPLSPGSSENVYFARYSLIVAPWLSLWIALGSRSLFDVIRQVTEPRMGGRASIVTAAVFLGILAAWTAPPWQAKRSVLREAYRANCAEIEATQVSTARWIDENLSVYSVIGVSDAGALRFFTKCRIIDLVGLNTHEMLRARDPVAYLADQGLTHLVVWPHWHRRWSGDRRLSTRFLRATRVERPTIGPSHELDIFEARIRR